MNIYSLLIEEQIRKDFDISEPETREAFPECLWWKITTGHLWLSLYYDPNDSLGYVGTPYFQLYDGDETYTYLLDDDPMDLILELHKQKAIYTEQYEKNPEEFL